MLPDAAADPATEFTRLMVLDCDAAESCDGELDMVFPAERTLLTSDVLDKSMLSTVSRAAPSIDSRSFVAWRDSRVALVRDVGDVVGSDVGTKVDVGADVDVGTNVGYK